MLLALCLACSGDQSSRKDTTVPEGSPPGSVPGSSAAPRTWDVRAGALFAVRAVNGTAWLVNPDWSEAQALDTLVASMWNPEGAGLTLLEGNASVGSVSIPTARFDSTCAGWPTADLGPSPGWRVAFPEGRVAGIAFDSLPALSAADSGMRVREGALAASRLADDTASAFRGHPFSIRQAIRFAIAADTVATLFEVIRLVAQEANPQEEKLILITEDAPPFGSPRTRYHERLLGLEESMPSLDVVAVLRVNATGHVALLVRREQESGFAFEWIERTRGTWRVRWRSALDSC